MGKGVEHIFEYWRARRKLIRKVSLDTPRRTDAETTELSAGPLRCVGSHAQVSSTGVGGGPAHGAPLAHSSLTTPTDRSRAPTILRGRRFLLPHETTHSPW